MNIVVTARRLYTPTEEIADPWFVIEDGHLVEISSRASRAHPTNATFVDLGDTTVVPGFLDIHLHGGAGLDKAPADDAIVARPLGIHLEGPFLSHKRRGVHPPEYLVEPTIPIFERLWQAARGHVRMMTIAPEIPGAMEVISEAVRRKVCVSIGHSDAELPAARQAVGAGAHHATHTFNAMRPLDHRNPGIIGEVLSNDTMTADIIADGIHVSPEVVKLFLEAKGPERAVLITDAISAAGMPDGHYQLGPAA